MGDGGRRRGGGGGGGIVRILDTLRGGGSPRLRATWPAVALPKLPAVPLSSPAPPAAARGLAESEGGFSDVEQMRKERLMKAAERTCSVIGDSVRPAAFHGPPVGGHFHLGLSRSF
jgi:hypothetical protein